MNYIYVGRLDELKGIKVLFEAWRIMGNDAPMLIVCGTGPLEEWCRNYIVEHKIENIQMKGKVENSECKKLIAESEALILPSLWYEGFPMTIVEAYSVGTPVICSNIGNASAVVKEGITGWKFKAGNAIDLVAVIHRTSDISESVNREYLEKYTEEVNYNNILNVYGKAQ